MCTPFDRENFEVFHAHSILSNIGLLLSSLLFFFPPFLSCFWVPSFWPPTILSSVLCPLARGVPESDIIDHRYYWRALRDLVISLKKKRKEDVSHRSVEPGVPIDLQGIIIRLMTTKPAILRRR